MRRSKRLLAVGLVAALGVAVSACGDDDDGGGAEGTGDTTEGTSAGTSAGTSEGTSAGTTEGTAGGVAPSGDCAAEDYVCIGLVTDVGKVDDKSFNQSAWEGAQQAAEDVGGEAHYIETANATDYANNIKQFTDAKYDIILTWGFALGEATAAAAKANPETQFIGGDQFQADDSQANLTGILFPEDQAGFLAGALAGLLTESGTIAAVLGTDQVPPVVAFKEGWENGAKYTNPDVKSISTFHPGGLDKAFDDPEWGGTTAKQALDNGADIVFGAGGKTGNGALIEVAKKDGALCVGVDTDQWLTVPEAHPCLITSAMKLIQPAIVDTVKASVDGSLKPGNFIGAVGLADFHDLADRVPEEVNTQIEELIPQVLSGEVETGYVPGG
jgi:basic membrane protein A